jgi:hypothetical protein
MYEHLRCVKALREAIFLVLTYTRALSIKVLKRKIKTISIRWIALGLSLELSEVCTLALYRCTKSCKFGVHKSCETI